MDARFAEPFARGLVDRRLQPAAVDRELRKFEAGIGAAWLAPDFLADAVHVEKLVRADSDLVELREQAELRQLLDCVRQRVDADAQFAHAVGLLENFAVDAACVQHEGRGEPAYAAADNDRFHSLRPTLETGSIMRLAGRRGNRAAPQRLTLRGFLGPIGRDRADFLGRSSIMRAFIVKLVAAAALVFAVNAAAAQDKIRIGLIYTLSGPASVLGQQSKNGFDLALKDLRGKMGGKDVEL